jgi:hypothetical protein
VAFGHEADNDTYDWSMLMYGVDGPDIGAINNTVHRLFRCSTTGRD